MENKLLYKEDFKVHAKENVIIALLFGCATIVALALSYVALETLAVHIIFACIAAGTLSIMIYQMRIVIAVRSLRLEIYLDHFKLSRCGRSKEVFYADIDRFVIKLGMGDMKVIEILSIAIDPNTGKKYELKSGDEYINLTKVSGKSKHKQKKGKNFLVKGRGTSFATKYYRELASLIGPHKCVNIDSLEIR